jgi:hypothetical protein
MLEEMIQHCQLMSREGVETEIKRALVDALVSGTKLPRRQEAIAERLDILKRSSNDRFPFAVTDFVMWLNGERATFTPAPAPPTFKDPVIIMNYLPYDTYKLNINHTTLELQPSDSRNGTSGLVTKEDAKALLLKLKNDFDYALFLKHDGIFCKIMWMREDGLTSVYFKSGYLVRPLKELLCAP